MTNDNEPKQEKQNPLLESALKCRAEGIAVIPETKDKVLNKLLRDSYWKKYRGGVPTEDDIRNWWTQYPDAEIVMFVVANTNDLTLRTGNQVIGQVRETWGVKENAGRHRG